MSREVWKGRVTSFWFLQTAGWFVYWLLIFMTFWTVIPEGAAVAPLAALKLARSVIGFGLSGLLRPVYGRVAEGASPARLVALVVGCSAVFGCAWTVLEAVYRKLAFAQFNAADWLARSPRVALDCAVTLVAWSALYLGLKYWGAWREAREQALRSEALAQKARLEALRYQLNPHFLFNSLNSLRALIDEDPSRARRMVTELAEFMRHSLVRGDGDELTPLGEEVETIENYLSIEKARFEEKLDVTVDVEPEAREWLVPPFLLHPLVENAVKHGMRTSPMPLRVELRARAAGGRLRLEVGNTGAWQVPAPGASGPEGTGTGLSNVRSRLEQLYPGRHTLSVTREAGRVYTVVELEGEGAKGV